MGEGAQNAQGWGAKSSTPPPLSCCATDLWSLSTLCCHSQHESQKLRIHTLKVTKLSGTKLAKISMKRSLYTRSSN